MNLSVSIIIEVLQTIPKGGDSLTEQKIRSLMRENPEQGNRAIFETYYNYVYVIVSRKMQGFPRMDIEECVIDVFAEVMRNFGAIQQGSLKAYIGAVSHNKAVNTCRTLSAKTRQTISIDDENFGELPSNQDIQENLEQSELSRKLLECINSLGEPDSTIILQKYFFDRNSIEIARILNMNPITIRSRTSRAIKKLKPLLTKMGITL